MKKLQETLLELGFVAADRHVNREAVASILSGPLDLPLDYADFLLATGGGGFDDDVAVAGQQLPPIAERGLTSFGDFFDLNELREWLDVDELRGEKLWPFASAAGGDVYCFRWRKGVEVVYWDHDSGQPYLCARSFTDLVQRLQKDDHPDGDVDLGDSTMTILNPDYLE